MPELMAFIARWKADTNDVSKAEVEEAGGIWFGGAGISVSLVSLKPIRL